MYVQFKWSNNTCNQYYILFIVFSTLITKKKITIHTLNLLCIEHVETSALCVTQPPSQTKQKTEQKT